MPQVKYHTVYKYGGQKRTRSKQLADARAKKSCVKPMKEIFDDNKENTNDEYDSDSVYDIFSRQLNIYVFVTLYFSLTLISIPCGLRGCHFIEKYLTNLIDITYKREAANYCQCTSIW